MKKKVVNTWCKAPTISNADESRQARTHTSNSNQISLHHWTCELRKDVIRSHGLPASGLQEVAKIINIMLLKYASQAWLSYTRAESDGAAAEEDEDEIHFPQTPNVAMMVTKHWFSLVRSNEQHILYRLLPTLPILMIFLFLTEETKLFIQQKRTYSDMTKIWKFPSNNLPIG